MPSDPGLLTLAGAVAKKKNRSESWDSAWDTRWIAQ